MLINADITVLISLYIASFAIGFSSSYLLRFFKRIFSSIT